MTRLLDGPMKGTFLSLKRCPYFLRCTRVESDDWIGEADALDQLNDTPKPEEKVYVYVLASEVSAAFVDGTKGGKRHGWMEKSASYKFYPNQPPDDVLCDNAKWQAWCHEEAKRVKDDAPRT